MPPPGKASLHWRTSSSRVGKALRSMPTARERQRHQLGPVAAGDGAGHVLHPKAAQLGQRRLEQAELVFLQHPQQVAGFELAGGGELFHQLDLRELSGAAALGPRLAV